MMLQRGFVEAKWAIAQSAKHLAYATRIRDPDFAFTFLYTLTWHAAYVYALVETTTKTLHRARAVFRDDALQDALRVSAWNVARAALENRG